MNRFLVLLLAVVVLGGTGWGWSNYNQRVESATDRSFGGSPAAAVEVEQTEAAAEPQPATIDTAMSRLDDGDRKWNVAIIGDSTGNAPDEWVYLAFADIAREADRPLIVHNWSILSNSYESVSNPVTEGNNAPIEIWNGSASGKGPDYSTQHIDTMVPERPDLVIVSHGHNVAEPDDLVSGIRDLVEGQVTSWDRPPAVAVTLQNPQSGDGGRAATHAFAVDAVSDSWRNDERVALIDVFEAFSEAPNLRPLLSELDGIHPTRAGERLWADVVLEAIA